MECKDAMLMPPVIFCFWGIWDEAWMKPSPMAGHLEDLGPSELEFAMARGIGQGERTGLSSNDPWPS